MTRYNLEKAREDLEDIAKKINIKSYAVSLYGLHDLILKILNDGHDVKIIIGGAANRDSIIEVIDETGIKGDSNDTSS